MSAGLDIFDHDLGVLAEAAELYSGGAEMSAIQLEPPIISDADAANSLNIDLTSVAGMRPRRRDRKLAQVATKKDILQLEADQVFDSQLSEWINQQETNNAVAIGIAGVVGDEQALAVLTQDQQTFGHKNRLFNFAAGIARFIASDDETNKQASEFSARSALSDLEGSTEVIADAIFKRTIEPETLENGERSTSLQNLLVDATKRISLRFDRLALDDADCRHLIDDAIIIKKAQEKGLEVTEQIEILRNDLFRDPAQLEKGRCYNLQKLATVTYLINELVDAPQHLFDDLNRINFLFTHADGNRWQGFDRLDNYAMLANLIEYSKKRELEITEILESGVDLSAQTSGTPEGDFAHAIVKDKPEILANTVSQLPSEIRMLGYFAIVATQPNEYAKTNGDSLEFPVKSIRGVVQSVNIFDNIRRTTQEISQSGGFLEWQRGKFVEEALAELEGPEDMTTTPDYIMTRARQTMRDIGSESDTAEELRALLERL